jgi:arylsulfatase A-like enzyme
MTKPNVIFILIDDLGWRDLGCYGSPFYETPQIDRLSVEGMRFTDAYAAAPVCSPTRASILSGKYPATVGVTDWIDWGGFVHPARGRLIDAPYIDHLPLREYSLPKALKAAGYHTWHVGKWHLGSAAYYPDQQGFDVNIGGCAAGLPSSGYWSPWRIPTLDDGPPGEYLTDHLTDEAIGLIQNNDGQPFYLNLWHYAVHTPLQAPLHLIKKYDLKAKALGLDQQPAFEEGAFFPCAHKKDQRITRRLLQSDPVYAAMIENLDANIGRLLQAVDEAGLTQNTIVIFTSDNGGLATAEGSPTSNAPLAEGKGWMYEGGTRVPLLVKWPGVTAPGTVCDVPVSSPDFYPTMLEMAGLDLLPEQHRDGVSMLPLLQGHGTLERPAIFWHYPHYGNQGGIPGSSIRYGEYKLIEFFEDRRMELYDLRQDIGEEHDLAPTNPDLVARLHSLLTEWREQVEARIPEPNPDYRP